MTGLETDLVYEAVAAAAASFVRAGVTDVVISPGSRSTPLTLGMNAQPRLRTWIQIDERSAGFFALGIGKTTGRPAVLVCTSGTAAANYLPAVIEAHHANVPLVVVTADRPPDVRGWGTNQTIDQIDIFGSATRWATSLALVPELTSYDAAQAATTATNESMGARPGPSHINWPLRKPLEPEGDVVVELVDGVELAGEPGQPVRSDPAGVPESKVEEWADKHERGLIVVGPVPGIGVDRSREQARQITDFAAASGWPVIADPASQIRFGGEGRATVVAAATHLLGRPGLLDRLEPDVVVLVGHTPTATPVLNWLLAKPCATVVLVDPGDQWADSVVAPTHRVVAPVADAFATRIDRGPTAWTRAWAAADQVARDVVRDAIQDTSQAEASTETPLGPGVMAAIMANVAPNTTAVISNSMPIRDLDGFVPTSAEPVTVVANRGAAGIDGITSTALGVAAASSGPVVAVLGDVALVHDLGAVLGAARLGLALTVVVIDNGGGAIFDNLPIADRLDNSQFDRLFRTPPGLDLATLDALSGVRAQIVTTSAVLGDAVRRSVAQQVPGCDILIVKVDAAADLMQHRAVNAALAMVETADG